MEDSDFTVWIEAWFERLPGRFDRIDKFMEILTARHNILEGERLLDNQDLCQLLNVSKRTLQRYRTEYGLPYQTLYHKTYYKESDVEAFIQKHFNRDNHVPGTGKDEI